MAGRKPTEPFWTEKIRGILAADSRKSSRAIHDELMAFGASPAGAYPPAPRTIDEIKKSFLALPDEDQRQYEKAYWPESFVAGALPWEASEATLELLNLSQTYGAALGRPQTRPSVRLARWFYRATQAMPGAKAKERRIVAGVLAATEILGGLQGPEARRLEGWLAYRAWTPEGERDHFSAVDRGSVEDWVAVLTRLPEKDSAQYDAALMEVLLGLAPEDLRAWHEANDGRPEAERRRLPLIDELFEISGLSNEPGAYTAPGGTETEPHLEKQDD